MLNNHKWIFKQACNPNAEIRIFLFPHAAGTPALYENWQNYFPETVDICPILYPMRSYRTSETMPDTLEALTADFITDCQELFEIPCICFGHSMGAQIAYETAYQLSQKGKQISALFLSACESPDKTGKNTLLPYKNALTAEKSVLLEILRSYDHMLENALLEDEAFLEYYLPIVRKDFYLSDCYFKEQNQSVHCDFYVLNAEGDMHIDLEKCVAWKQYTLGNTSEITFSGGHFYLESENNLQQIIELLQNEIHKISEKEVKV